MEKIIKTKSTNIIKPYILNKINKTNNVNYNKFLKLYFKIKITPETYKQLINE